MSNIIKDRLSTSDILLNLREEGISQHRKTFRTQILIGADPWVDKKTGITYLGEVWDDETNETVLGGSIYVLEKLFNNMSPLDIATINSIMGIATSGPNIDLTNGWPQDHSVSLFGVGIGGAGESSLTTYDVDPKIRELAEMVPLRMTSEPLTDLEKTQYWLKKTIPATATELERDAFYLKTPHSKQIKVLWKDAEEGEDGSAVESGVHNSTRTQPIEVFEELVLKLTKKDVNEYFGYNGNAEVSRINELGLFTGIKQTLTNGQIDYRYIKLFSACHINNEMLKYARDTTFIYRIYTN